MGLFSDHGDTILGGIGDVFGGVINNLMAKWREDNSRAQNFKYNEMSADNADARTRALYQDLQSPKALLQQYQDAGLSPSLMFGGSGAGGSVAQGAQGEGSSGIAPQTYGINPIQAAQLGLMNAQRENVNADTAKKQAETTNVQSQTELTNVQKGIAELEKALKSREDKTDFINFTISTAFVSDPKTGKDISMFDCALKHDSYASFVKYVRTYADSNSGAEYGKSLQEVVNTELGAKALREIYYNAREFKTDIEVLSTNEVSAEFQQSVIKALQNINYADLNANAIKEQFEAQTATNKLTASQKKAWNNLIKRLGEGEWYTDIIIALAMIFGNFASNSNIRLNTGDTYITTNKKE